MTERTDSVARAAVLSTGDAAGGWAWTGARLLAGGRYTASQRYPDLTWEERRRRLTAEEVSWLAAQWDPPTTGSRFELRFATGADEERVRVALLLRAVAGNPAQAQETASRRLDRAAGPHGALPPHFGATPLSTDAELLTWLQYPGRIEGYVELRKHVSVHAVQRPGSSLQYAVCHGFFDRGDTAWDQWWRSFAALDFPAVLCVGFEPYDAVAGVGAQIDRRRAQLEYLATGAVSSPVFQQYVPADPAAVTALPGYRRALATYTGHCYLVRVSLASAKPMPPYLLESLVRAVSSQPGAVRSVEVEGEELAQAIHEHRALGAPWLPETYQRGLMARLDPLDQLLHSVADVGEAASVLSMPVQWPGMEQVFDAVGSELRMPVDDQAEGNQMAEELGFTIEAADGSPPLTPETLRELRDQLHENDDLDLDIEVKNEEPAPGEQGAVPVALEIAVLGAPFAKAFGKVLTQWLISRQGKIKITDRKGRTVELSAENMDEARKALAELEKDESAGGE